MFVQKLNNELAWYVYMRDSACCASISPETCANPVQALGMLVDSANL